MSNTAVIMPFILGNSREVKRTYTNMDGLFLNFSDLESIMKTFKVRQLKEYPMQ